MIYKKAAQENEQQDSFEYVITEYPPFGIVTVAFELPYLGWKKLERSDFWHEVRKHLSVIQKEHSQT